mmetsp:Transcript_45063/g.146392  ORF Transcript_45063/g.146392 Transcript_45063/m.146392 type:complete len:410 (+) Transcript_45063:65-1294(+)
MQPLLNPLAAASPPRSLVRDGAFWTAVLTTANAALGAGVLAYPVAFQGAGLAGGSLLLLGFATTASVGLGAVFQCMSAARRLDPRVRDYTKMVGAAFGTTAEALVTVLIVLYVFGACWGYLVLLSDTLGPLVRKVAPAVDESLVRTLLQCGSTAVCIGLCSLRSINTLKYSSALAVAAVLTTVVMLVRNYAAHPCTAGDCATAAGPTAWCPSGECSGWCTAEQLAVAPTNCPGGTRGVALWPSGAEPLLGALPLVAFALQCHIQGAAVYHEMPPRLQSSRAAFAAIAGASSCLLLLLYLPTGLAGYAAFGAITQGDILTNFGVDDPLADVARGCIAVTALCAYPMQHYPARLVLHNGWSAMRARLRTRGAPSSPPGDASVSPLAAPPPAQPPPAYRAAGRVSGLDLAGD